jgi:hypothetical protein
MQLTKITIPSERGLKFLNMEMVSVLLIFLDFCVVRVLMCNRLDNWCEIIKESFNSDVQHFSETNNHLSSKTIYVINIFSSSMSYQRGDREIRKGKNEKICTPTSSLQNGWPNKRETTVIHTAMVNPAFLT